MVRSIRKLGTHGFLQLPENRLAHFAVLKLAPQNRIRKDGLVVVYGPAGVGKSELVAELLRQWDGHRQEIRLQHVLAGEFATQYAVAAEADSLPQFQARYRRDVGLFICEDVQSLQTRSAAQRELTAIMDDVLAHGGRVLITMNRPPGEVTGLIPRLINRCQGGVCVAMDPPGLKSRERLLLHFAASQQLPLTAEVAHTIASQVTGTARELLGFLAQLNALLAQRRRIPMPQLIGQLLERQVQRAPWQTADIARESARYFEVTLAELRGPRRAQPLVLARHVAMYLARELAGGHLQEIGEYFGGRNHTTVLHAYRQIADRLGEDPVVARHVEQLRQRLGATRLPVTAE